MERERPTDRSAGEDSYTNQLDVHTLEHDRLAELLVDAEQRLAEVPELKRRITDLEFELSEARRDAAAARREATELDQMLMYGRRMLRLVRPLIKPLRYARRRLRG